MGLQGGFGSAILSLPQNNYAKKYNTGIPMNL
jgi:hypothetical protein